MSAELIRESDTEVVVQVTIKKSSNFYECEKNIREALNEGGAVATGKCLEDFDADGSPIMIGKRKLTAKRTKISKKYETPYGVTAVNRYAYQGSEGGAVFYPMEANARIVGSSTPLFAQSVSYLYSNNDSSAAQSSLEQTTGRTISRCLIQDLSAVVAEQVEAKSRHLSYSHCEPTLLEVSFVTIGLDGTCMLFCGKEYRQAMVGTIAFYDANGERLHTNYIAAAPEHGKATFLQRMDEEIERIKNKYGSVRYVGISDGAADFLPWLKRHTSTQVLDFWHVTEYLSRSAGAIHRSKAKQEKWLAETCHALKHNHGAAELILAELEEAFGKRNLSSGVREKLAAALTYFGNNMARMNYASYRKTNLPIGSGITEAACKTVVKSRMCGSGMKWKHSGSDGVLTLRALSLTTSRWQAFWDNLAKNGLTTI